MDTASKPGLTVLNILESGEKTELMEKGNSFMLMVMYMTGSGQMIKPMALEFTNM